MMAKDKQIRVRMAPSPTGNLHIGTARTGLFNFLFARRHRGIVLLRIEDTDAARSTAESEENILNGFARLGITFDEGVMSDGSEKGEYGPYRQSARTDLYERYLQQLLDEHKAYYCFCSKEVLDAQRESQQAAGQSPRYVGTCRSLAKDQVEAFQKEGKRGVIRIKVPDGKRKFMDLVRGEVEFELGLLGDMVIAKSLRAPLYNFVVVVDDFTMEISHVIRGDDHINNTPKQLVIADALGFSSPAYAHVPVILSATGKGKMSKRDGGTAIEEYLAAGYLPEALVNFLVLLGWHPGPEQLGLDGSPVGDREFFVVEELVTLFDLDRVQKGGARFSLDKLNHFNNQYIRRLEPSYIVKLLIDGDFVPQEWLEHRALLERVVAVEQERLATLGYLRTEASFFFEIPPYDPRLLVWKKSDALSAEENLQAAREAIKAGADMMALAGERGRGDLLWPLRVALSGLEHSPGPLEILTVIGKDEALVRIDSALDKLSSLTTPQNFSQ